MKNGIVKRGGLQRYIFKWKSGILQRNNYGIAVKGQIEVIGRLRVRIDVKIECGKLFAYADVWDFREDFIIGMVAGYGNIYVCVWRNVQVWRNKSGDVSSTVRREVGFDVSFLLWNIGGISDGLWNQRGTIGVGV